MEQKTQRASTRKIIIGVMGPGEQATDRDCQLAYELGQSIAQQGWVLLTGGRAVGVMDAVNRGAKQAGGLTLGILPSADDQDRCEAVDIVIATGMGYARNVINILSSEVVIACGMGSGTASEIAIAIKVGKPVVLLNSSPASQAFFRALSDAVVIVNAPEEAVEQAKQFLSRSENCSD